MIFKSTNSKSLKLKVIFGFIIAGLVVIMLIESRRNRHDQIKLANIETHNLTLTLEQYTTSVIAKTDLMFEHVQSIYQLYQKNDQAEDFNRELFRIKSKIPENEILSVTNEK